MSDDVLVEKALTVQRCVIRAREQYAVSADFATDHDRQDIAVLNIQRAYEAAIDIAFRIVRIRQLGAPTSNAGAFDILVFNSLLPAALGEALKKMIGFRNIAVHQYQKLDIAILESVIRSSLDDLLTFSATALRLP